jgi:hypothetical protein
MKGKKRRSEERRGEERKRMNKRKRRWTAEGGTEAVYSETGKKKITQKKQTPRRRVCFHHMTKNALFALVPLNQTRFFERSAYLTWRNKER